MEREISDRNILDRFCEDFCSIIDKHCKYIIVSGFFAIASGRIRGTEDIDLIMERTDLNKFKQIFQDLTNSGFVCIQSDSAEEVYDYLKDNVSVRFTWRDKEVPEMEVKFVKDDLDLHQLNTREKIELTGLDVWFSNVNMNIAFKEELLKSPKDLEDARLLRIVYSERINEADINLLKKMIRRYRL